MQAVHEHGATEWKTNLGLNPEPDDEGLYTETQVQKMWESFEQSVTDPENQPSQYGTVLMKEWQGLTDEEAVDIEKWSPDIRWAIIRTEAKLRSKNES
jgi:hypothetical protein